MGPFTAGQVVSLPFPFSDLSRDKSRPVLLLADVGREDWIVYQITSNPYADFRAIRLVEQSFAQGSLQHASYVRPGKLFTANEAVIVAALGRVHPAFLEQVRQAVIALIAAKPAPPMQ